MHMLYVNINFIHSIVKLHVNVCTCHTYLTLGNKRFAKNLQVIKECGLLLVEIIFH